jgi:hypothetical protein
MGRKALRMEKALLRKPQLNRSFIYRASASFKLYLSFRKKPFSFFKKSSNVLETKCFVIEIHQPFKS